MFLAPFHTQQNDEISISADQGSRFAKEISNDFNPLHNVEHKRFVVPGDLLFALTLAKFGIFQNMKFNFVGMVGKENTLFFPPQAANTMAVTDGNEKTFLEIECQGENSLDASLTESFTRAYVAFSGQSFPHILVPLMQQHNVMINPARPMVMYESMAFEFDTFSPNEVSLQLVDSSLEVNGKRGLVRLEFDILDQGTKVGHGYKTMTLSGLREYDQHAVDGLIELYEESKRNYLN